jgi:hypothetical protein
MIRRLPSHPPARHRLVRLDRRHGDALGQIGASSHRTGVRDDLDLHRFFAETGQDDAVEYIALEKGTGPTDLCALVVERLLFDGVHGLEVLLVSSSDGTSTVDVEEHLEVTPAFPPVRPDLVKHLADRLALFYKVDQRGRVPIEVQVQRPDEVTSVERQIHLHPGGRVLDEALFLEHVE